MTNPKEKKEPIRTRTPGRLSRSGMFDRVQLRPPAPHPIEEIINAGTQAEGDEANNTTGVPEYRSTGVAEQVEATKQDAPTVSEQAQQSTTAVPQYRSTAAIQSSPIPTREFYRKPNQTADHLDRRLTPSESKVLDHLLRLSVGFNKDRCQVRISVLMERTGYRSDKTVRLALKGLELKGAITVNSQSNSPAGDEYIIHPYSGNTAVPEYRSTAAENTAVLESKITGQLNTELKDKEIDDDAQALAAMNAAFREAVKDVTGKELSAADAVRWKEVADVLIAELKIAAARTTVSSVPSFLAEHLRRRLWKMDKKQAHAEGRELPDESVGARPSVDASGCPDCGGSGWWYPQGQEKGVAKCRHEKLARER